MMNSKKFWLATGCVLGAFSVVMGAFGAHALAPQFDDRSLSIYQTAVQYQFYHSLALVMFGLWIKTTNMCSAWIAGFAFLAGIFLFSGSLYLLVLTGISAFGAITPIGGVLFVLGWLAWFCFVVRGE